VSREDVVWRRTGQEILTGQCGWSLVLESRAAPGFCLEYQGGLWVRGADVSKSEARAESSSFGSGRRICRVCILVLSVLRESLQTNGSGVGGVWIPAYSRLWWVCWQEWKLIEDPWWLLSERTCALRGVMERGANLSLMQNNFVLVFALLILLGERSLDISCVGRC
jgi:hypothetical protein